MNPAELKDRTKQFALRILKLVAALPKTVEGRAIANLLPPKRIDPLLTEVNELVAIMVASRKSASSNLQSAL
jgi:hypothetical protein